MAKAVIFDVDGVILDTEVLAAQASIQAIKELCGYDLAVDDFHEFQGNGVEKYLEGALAKYGVKLDDMSQLIDRRLEIVEELMKKELKAFPGVKEFIIKVQNADIKTAIASSAQHEKITEGFKDVGIDLEPFEVVLSGDDIKNKKPAPDIYLLAAKKLNIPPNECIVIEDAIFGVQAAKAAGMVCVAVLNSFEEERLIEAGADVVVEALDELSLIDIETL
jgi:beta-phosphoglucomutase